MNTGHTTRKVAVIGVGYVGTSIVYALTIKGLAREIVLIDRLEACEKVKAEVNDIRHGIPYMGSSNIYSGSYSDIKDCDLIIIAAGRNRKQNESRLEMAADNIKIAAQIAESVMAHYTKGVVLAVTNPVDIVTYALTTQLALPDGVVFGTGCLLDSSRLTNVVADYIGLSADAVNAMIIGEHGDGQIALWSKATVAGIPIREYCEISGLDFSESKTSSMEEIVRKMGTAIIAGKERTHYGIATCVCYIADAILNCRSTIISVSSVLRGEYGINDVALSLPSIVGANGVERRLVDKLDESEITRLIDVSKTLKTVLSHTIRK